MSTLRLLVASGNEIARKGLCTLVREQPGWDLAVEARDGREAVEKSHQVRPDIAILDLDMPSLNGLDATRQIAKVALRTKVLILASADEDRLLLQVLDAGAHGYLLKSVKANDLIFAVETMHKDRPLSPATLAREVPRNYLEARKNAGHARHESGRLLTRRQRQVVQLLAEGSSNKHVGMTLNISVKTAETHRANIMRRIQCHSLAGLVRYAIRNRIIEA